MFMSLVIGRPENEAEADVEPEVEAEAEAEISKHGSSTDYQTARNSKIAICHFYGQTRKLKFYHVFTLRAHFNETKCAKNSLLLF